jgi:DNA-binding MarR family transcriptional regulator
MPIPQMNTEGKELKFALSRAFASSYASRQGWQFLCKKRITIYVYASNYAIGGIVIDLSCMCASFRRASRALTQMYEQELRPEGLRATQFTILQALTLAGEITQGQLGGALAMDSTTLTRTLTIMRRGGWVSLRRGEDRREWRLVLTKEGEAMYKRALPAWERIQKKLRKQIGSTEWEQLLKMTNGLAHTVVERGER